MKLSSEMAYKSADEMIFGTAKKPVKTKRGLVLGGGHVVPEIVPHPRPGSEKTMKTLLREYERANGDALERCVIVGHPQLQIENEHIFQMSHNPKWGGEIAAQSAKQMDDYLQKYGLKAAYRATIADLRKPDMVNMRDSDYTREVLESFEECAKYADIISIESMGGKEVFDHAIIRNDVAGLLFGQAVLGGRDMEWMWNQIVAIAKKNNCIAGGDTNCAEANTAMFMAGGFLSKDVPHTLAALSRAICASRTIVAYECGATGPTKDCAYEDPIIKAVTGVPISCEGKTSACAHADLCGNVIAAVTDVWSNEAVEYHDMFGGSTTAVFTEILGYDVAAMNAAIDLGYQKEYQACLVNSDKYRGPHGFMLSPDNAWQIGKALVDNNASLYSRAKAAAMKCGELMLGDPKLKLTAFEKESLQAYMKDMQALPDKESDFIDMCLKKYAKVKGFIPAAYGL
ncbi:MAG TPA: methyltransferase MtaB domain-containing protein [Desulfomonilaceae bacterium]|nr:methyltransferase MtaB domain-containing protein [Desulfomonilaceae bacterium]